MKWYAIQIKQVYDRPSQYAVLKEILLSPKYGLTEDQIWISGDGVRENLYQGYVFLHMDGEFKDVWTELQRERLIDKDMGWVEIPDEQMNLMSSQAYPEKEHEEYNLLDVVMVDEGPWSKLYGIVTENRGKDQYEVGVKLHMKNFFLLLSQKKLHRCKSLFEVWKFKK